MPTVGWLLRLAAMHVPAMKTRHMQSAAIVRPSRPLTFSIIRIPLSSTYLLPFVDAGLRAEVAEFLLEALGRFG